MPDTYKDVNGNLHLSPRKKRDILVNNIYGVDIDRQAVEVTQMSLYLKVLEGENAETLNPQMTLALKEVYLPSMADNIKCGNSLIGTDFTSQGDMFDDEARHKVNPFDWEAEFPEILGSKLNSPPTAPPFNEGGNKGGFGFDVVIGNPPYGMIHDEEYKNYYVNKYETTEGRFDTFEIFIEKGIKLCGKDGLLGYIVPSPLLSNLYSRKLRRYLLDNHSIKQIINFGMDVFEDPTIHTCIVVVGKGKIKKNTVAMRKQVNLPEQLYRLFDYEIVQSDLGNNENATIDIFIDPSSNALLKKLNQNAVELGDVCFIRQCIKTGDDETLVQSSKKVLKNPWKPTLRGRSIDRYMTIEKDLYLKYGDWLARNWKNKTFYETPKIGIRETGNRIIATEDIENRYFLSSLYSIYPNSKEEKRALRYFLALLNSKLSTFFIKKIAFELTKGAFTKVRTNQLGRLPIRTIDFNNSVEKKMHDDLVVLVEKMLELNKNLQCKTFDSEREPH